MTSTNGQGFEKWLKSNRRLEENKVIPTGSYDELIRRGLKVKEVFDIVKEVRNVINT